MSINHYSDSNVLKQEEDGRERLEQDILEIDRLLNKSRMFIERQVDAEQLLEKLRPFMQVELCRFVKMMVKNPHQKIDEIIQHDNIKKENPHSNFVISEKTTGADLIDIKTGAAMEIKVSTIKTSSKHPKCNFSWNIPVANTKEEARKALVESVARKTRDGMARFVINDGKGVHIKSYNFSSLFLQQYFSHCPISDKSTKINLGCEQCPSCKSFHRLDTLEEMANRKSITENEWTVFMSKRIASNCCISQK